MVCDLGTRVELAGGGICDVEVANAPVDLDFAARLRGKRVAHAFRFWGMVAFRARAFWQAFRVRGEREKEREGRVGVQIER